MEKKMFTNYTKVNFEIHKVEKYLSSPIHLSEWNYAIKEVKKNDDGTYNLTREYDYGEENETIKVMSTVKNIIEFVFTGGRINYRVVFKLDSLNENFTEVNQTVYIDDENHKIMTPFISLTRKKMKKAFLENLETMHNFIK